ncbi:MAG: PorT family protein [Tannerellaceae bacterium]|nr:PorT family protein [Tannerellaceae bacterium]
MNYRKIISLAFCVIGLSFASHAQFRYGVKGGMNLSTIHFNKDLFSPQSLVGYQAGFTSEYIIPKSGIGADLSLMFVQTGVEQRSKHYAKNYIEIPVNFKWRYSLPFVNAYVHAGPYIAWALKKDDSWSVTVSKTSSTGIPGTATVTAMDTDAGINAGLGVEFLKYFQVGIQYRLGLKDAYKVSYSGNSYAQNRGILINAAILF